MATPESTELADGPVLSFMNKRLRALRKKHNRIIQMEESLAQGKILNKEQEEVLRSKSAVLVLIDEYEKLRQPLSKAVQEELSAARAPPSPAKEEPEKAAGVEDLLTLLYFGSLFDVKPQSEFTSTMLTRTHERECCLTYDYVTDESTDLLGEGDLDQISALLGFLISRPLHSDLSHKNALRSCVDHAKLWLANADQPIQPGIDVTYAGLRERLNKIMASDYFTTTPEMKAPVDVAAAAGKYAPSQVPAVDPPVSVPGVEEEETLSEEQYQQEVLKLASFAVEPQSTVGELGCQTKDNPVVSFDDRMNAQVYSRRRALVLEPEQVQEFNSNSENEDEVAIFHEKDPVDQSSSVEEPPKMDESDLPNPVGDIADGQNQSKQAPDTEELDDEKGSAETKEYVPRRAYHNQRGGGNYGGGGSGGRRGYPNGRGGRSGRGGGNYQNGRNQFYDSGNYYPRNYYNSRGRGGGRSRGGGTAMYNNHEAANGSNGHGSAVVEPGRS